MKRMILNMAILLVVVVSCDKREEEFALIDCNVEVSQNLDWTTEDFKNDYIIQFPANYEGDGMTGFEGNVFQKRRTDDKVLFFYGYCSETFCEDFGDALAVPAPNSIIAKDKNGNDVVLDSKKRFCVNDEIVGILLYNTEKDAVGKYFMNQGSEFLEGLTIYFPYTEYQEVENIVKTIFLEEGCISETSPIKSLEEEYSCENTKYQMDIELSDDYTIIRSESAFNALVSGSCNPQIDFSSYDLVMGKKQLTSGNSSIEYRVRKDCNSNKLQLMVIFHQNETTEAPNLTYHTLIPKLGDEETAEVEIVVK